MFQGKNTHKVTHTHKQWSSDKHLNELKGRRSSRSTDNGCQWVCHSHETMAFRNEATHSLRKTIRISILDLHKNYFTIWMLCVDCYVLKMEYEKSMWNSQFDLIWLFRFVLTRKNAYTLNKSVLHRSIGLIKKKSNSNSKP